MDPLKTSATQESKLHFLDYWRIIRIRKTVILAVFLLVVITATLVTFVLPESFSSTARIKVERDITDITPITGQAVPGTYDPYFIQTEFEVIQSEIILGEVVKSLNLTQVWGKKYNNGVDLTPNEAMSILKGRMDLRPVRNTSLIEIRVFSEKPEEARDLANAIADTYSEHRQSQRRKLSNAGIKSLEDRWNEQERKVREVQTNVDQLRKELKISEVDAQASQPTPLLEAETVRMLHSQLLTMKNEQIRMQTTLSKLKELTPEQIRNAIQTAIGPDAELQNLLTDYNLAQQTVLAMERDLGPENSKLQYAKKAVTDLNEKIDKRVEGVMLGLQTRVDQADAAVSDTEKQLTDARTKDVENAEKTRPYYEAKARLEELVRFRQILGMKIASEQTDVELPKQMMVEVIDRAVVGTKPVKPNKPLNIVLGVVIGLVVGVGLAFFIEYLDTSVKTIDDVERTLQAPVLGVIPQNVGYLLEEGSESPHAEAYRVLRTNLLFSRKDDKLNTIAVVSAGAGEGKSTTIFNLATVFAQTGQRVLMVDSDLRRPTLHKMLHVTNNLGLTNYLLKQNTLEEVIQTTKIPTLDFMASGKLPSSSMGILSSAQMKD